MTPITPEGWANLLENVVMSRDPHNVQEHLYVTQAAGKSYRLLRSSELPSKKEQMSLNQIVDITCKQFEILQESFTKNEVTEEKYKDLAARLSRNTDKIVDGMVKKRNQIGKIFLRAMAYLFAVATGVFGIGILLFKKLRKMDNDFNEMVSIFKHRIHLKEAAYNKSKVDAQLRRIPEVLAFIDSQVTESERLELLQKNMLTNYPSNFSVPIVPQFEGDIRRGISFTRADKALKIEDKTPQPSLEMKGESRVHPAAALIDELLKYEADESQRQYWKYAIQLAVTQTCLNNIFDGVIGMFLADSINNGNMWEDSIDGSLYNLKVDFPTHLPTIHLEIIRDPIHLGIKEVHVSVEGSLNMVAETKGKSAGENTVAHDVIKGKLNFVMTLDEKGRPDISAMQTKLEVGQIVSGMQPISAVNPST